MRSMKAFQPPWTLSNEHRLSGGSAFYANNRNSWGVAPGFLRSQTLYLKKQIFTGVKRRREGKECGREGGREGGCKKRKKESRHCLNPKYFIDVLKYLEGILRCLVNF